MADKVDVMIENEVDFKRPLNVNLYFVKNQPPTKVMPLDRKTSYLSSDRAVITLALIIGLTIVIIGGVLVISRLIRNDQATQIDNEMSVGLQQHKPPIQIDPQTQPLRENDNSGGTILRMVTRDEWLARPESEPLTLLQSPVHRVIIFQTSTDNCTSQASCSARTQNIQGFHMDSRGYGDIGYNFLIGGDGAIYEGRGWDKQGAHTLGYNSDGIGIAFIGTYTKLNPTEGQLSALKLIMAEGVRLKKLVEDYRLYGARQFVGTESPGNAIYEIIKKWPHWSRSPY